MKRPGYCVCLINPQSVAPVRRIKVTGFVVAVLVCFLVAGSAGLVRLALFATSCAQAKLGFYNERKTNEHLVLKISVLDKFLLNETKKIDCLAAFEDSTRLAYGMEPISADVRKAGIGGPSLSSKNFNSDAANPLITKAVAVQKSLTVLLRKVQLQNATFTQMGDEVEHLHSVWEQRPSIVPVEGNVTSGFGYRPDPVTGQIAFHDGYDFANETGTPVHATADGIVSATGFMQDYGMTVIVSHPENGLETIYAHLSTYTVYPNQRVKRGDFLGSVGNSGKSTGSHLHYEIRKDGHPVSPSRYILPADQVVD
jgi:murein DD-endopeptidase MepM/ murein hydrolase activator NlpD